MDETTEKVSPEKGDTNVPESPKPLAFTIDFGEGKSVDTERYKNLVEKYQNRHRRGQSLSKFEDTSTPSIKKHPLTGNLPRKSSFHSEGYFSSDEKVEKFKYQGVRSTVLNTVISKGDLTLPLRNLASDRMKQSFSNRNFELPSINSPEIELKDVSSPELDLISPVSPLNIVQSSNLKMNSVQKVIRQHSSPECDISPRTPQPEDGPTTDPFVCGADYDFEKSDTISDTGTYTIETDNYTEEQKARMSIDKYFNIEQVSVIKKTQEYIESLHLSADDKPNTNSSDTHNSPKYEKSNIAQITLSQNTVQTGTIQYAQSPPNNTNKITKKIFNKVLYPSSKYQNADESESNVDLGVFTSITASGVLSKRPDRSGHARRSSLAQSEIFVEAYTGDGSPAKPQFESTKLMQSNMQKRNSCTLNEGSNTSPSVARVSNLPPPVGGLSGKNSPTKIPSPVHTITRARSRNSWSSQNLDLSDSSLETESYLKPTENIISSLQARLSIDSDQDSDYDKKYNIALNNETKKLLKDKTMHVRHNSFDDRNVKISNKLEHFHNKNLQGIDQTLKAINQYSHRIQNSPNNSPIRRSSSFSLKNQLDCQPKCLNKDINIAACNSPNFQRNGTVQRSASTASIKANVDQFTRRSSINSEHKVNKTYLDTESSSDEDFEKNLMKNKKDLTNTRYNRAFSLRRARLDNEPPVPKCPNTPEMRRKFATNERSERTVSVDRKSAKAVDVQSRYLNISKPKVKVEPPKPAPKPTPKHAAGKPPVFSRTDTGRFSMRAPRPTNAAPKPVRRDQPGKKQSGPRSNSTLSSREVEFQNWKRRKSYDPMKAAAEGKRKAELARKQNQNVMTQSYNETNNQDCDSSPSHSSSVHRSQSFHGTAALEQLISSEDEDLTLSGDEEGFSPPTPSPCDLSPAKSNLRQIWMQKFTSRR